MLEAGFGSIVLETAGGVIFRVARTAASAAGHAVETRLLPAVRSAVTVAVPAPEWRVEPGDAALPHGAIGYRKLPGAPLSPDLARGDAEVAVDIARFLASLHAFPVEEARRIGVPEAPKWSETAAILEGVVLPALRGAATSRELDTLERWIGDVAAEAALADYRPSLCHRDIWFDNVLVAGEPPRLTGVLDWEAARIGDPAEDLAVQLHLGERFAAAVIAAYGSREPGFRHRIRRFWELREFGGLRWAIEQEDEIEFEDSLAKLRAGPILGPPASRTR